MAKVFVKFNAAIINEIKFTKDEIRFGRKPDNDIVINHPAVSSYHGKITKDGDGFIVEDLDSTNGTFVNGRRIQKSRLEDTDSIRVAKHILEYRTDDAAAKPTEQKEDDKTAAKKELLRKSLGLSPEEPPKEAPAKNALSEAIKKKQEQEAKLNPALLASKPKGGSLTSKPPHPLSEPAPKVKGDKASIKIVAGGVKGQTEVDLKELVTYIGSSEQAVIKIKGFLAPSLAAAISRSKDGFFLKAVKPGYPKVNGNPVHQQTLLESGSLIECGGTNMVFYLTDDKKKATEKNVKKD